MATRNETHCKKEEPLWLSLIHIFGEGKAMMLNNADWLLKLNYVDLLREVGACFSVNNMLRAECYKQRMEKGLSFLEFNYMIMQSYDFYHMFQSVGCNMQFGGDDQWSLSLIHILASCWESIPTISTCAASCCGSIRQTSRLWIHFARRCCGKTSTFWRGMAKNTA